MIAQVAQVTDAQDKWAEYHRYKFGCEIVRHRFQSPQSEAYGESIFFLNKKGKIYLPPACPYNFVNFVPTPTSKKFRISKQWIDISKLMIQQMLKTGMAADFIFPPDIQDVRPWKWAGFVVDVKYTYFMNFPYRSDDMDGDIRRKINKAHKAGYRCFRTDHMADVAQCLAEITASGRVVNRELSVNDLEMARHILGDDVIRSYVCYSSEGEPVSACTVLMLDGKRARGWLLGSSRAHLSNGVAQQLWDFIFSELSAEGLEGFDFAGANLEMVANAKATWGGDFVPYYTVRERAFKDVLRAGREWINFKKMHGGVGDADHSLT